MFKSKKTKIAIGVCVLLILIFIVSRSRQNKSTTSYQTSTAKVDTLVVSLSASGQVSSANIREVSTSASGVVKKIYVQNGQTIKANAPIIELELDADGQQKQSEGYSSYQSAKNSLESAKATAQSLNSAMWSAHQKLRTDAEARGLTVDDPTYIQQNSDWLAAEKKYITQSAVIQQAQTSLNSAWLAYRKASSVVYAPISGTVDGLSLQVGSVISASTTEAKIANIKTSGKPLVTVNLTQIDAPKVKVGQSATITLDAYPDSTFTGKVASVDTVGSVSSNVTSYPVTILFDSDSSTIFPNMSSSVSIITAVVDRALLVPNSAVSTQNGQSVVRVLKNGQPSSIEVETGLSSDSYTEIKSGLSENDEIITSVINQSTSSDSSQSPFGMFSGNRSGNVVRMR